MRNPSLFPENKFFNKKKALIKRYSFKKHEGDEWLIDKQEKPLKKVIDYSSIKRVFFFIFLLTSLLFIRLFFLQIVKGKTYQKIAEGNRIRIIEIKASRGLIYDRQGKKLVENIPDFYLTIVPGDFPKEENKREEVLNKLANLFDSSIKDKAKKILENNSPYSYQPVILTEEIGLEKAILFKTIEDQLPGVKLKIRGQRHYLAGQSFSHCLGYLGKITREEWLKKRKEGYSFDDYLGRSGLEAYYENLLKGEKGKKQIEVDSLGREKEVLNKKKAKPGKSLVLNIDSQLQKDLANALEKNIKRVKGKAGAAVALNPQNGQLLALVSFPGYDNNLFIKGLSQEKFEELINNPLHPLFFRPVSGKYPPGSTIKPLIALAALEEGIINSQTTINSQGGIRIGKWFFPDWKIGGHGLTNVRKAIAQSVNTFFYYIGGGYKNFKGLGIEKIIAYLKKYGLGKETGIDLFGEAKGFLPSPLWKEKVKKEKWYIGDTYHLAIGQGDILVTPLQVASYTAMIANGGTLFHPYLVKKIIDNESGKVEIVQPKIIKSNLAKKENIKIVQQGMRDAVLYGSARALINLPVKVAGKTGTAQVGGKKKPDAWFTCYAPYDNPEIVITVLIENGGEGHQAALPVAKEVLENYFLRKKQ